MKFIKWSFTIGFGLSALYHLFLAFIPKVGDVAIGQRHLIFFFINIGAMILVSLNHPKALLLLLPLILQQLYSHGLTLWLEWETYQQIDWPSVVVLVAMPILALYVCKMYKAGLKNKI